MQKLLFVAFIFMAGCASSSKPRQATRQMGPDDHQYVAAGASALAFDSPVTVGYALPGLDRAAREPGAFIGYQETITEYFSVGIDDHQMRDPYQDNYDRWSFSEKSGVRYR